MKKMKTKLISIVSMVLILLNIVLPVAQAALSTPPAQKVEEDDVDKTKESYLILELEYQAYSKSEYEANPLTATPKKTYVAGDIVKVEVKIKEAQGIGPIVTCSYNVFYDTNLLTLKSAKTPMDKYITYGTSIANGYIGHQFSEEDDSDVPNMTVGSTVTNLIFEAKTDSDVDNPTTIIVFNGDFSDDNTNPHFLTKTINTPSIVIPEQPEKRKHVIEITKVDEEGNPITTSSAIYRITTPAGDKKIVQTNETIADGKLYLSDLNMPVLAEGVDSADYIIEEVSAPEGYEIDRTPKTLSVKFDKTGTIIEAKIDENAQTVIDNTIKISFINNEEQQQTPVVPVSQVTFVVNKVNENGDLITDDSAAFGLKVGSEDMRYLLTTNGTATKQIDIPEDISSPISYVLNELEAPDGYILDGQDINIDVTFTKNADNTVSVTSATKTSGTNATVSTSGNVVTINVKNEKIKEQEKFQIEITKVDEEGNAITQDTAMFLITSPNGSSEIAQTDITNGKTILEKVMPQGDLVPEGYIYKIQEIKAPNGYKKNSDEISLNVKFVDENGTRKVSQVQITRKNVEENVTRRNNRR